MIELDRTVAGQDRIFPIYTVEEADDEGIPYVDWRVAREGGWAETDDGYVGECVKVQKYDKGDKLSYFFTFSFARKWLSRKRETGEIVGDPTLSFEDRHEKNAYYATSDKSWVEVELQRRRARRAIHLYATLMVANDGHLGDEEWELIGQAYKPHEKIPAATARVFFGNDQVQKVAQNKVAELFKDAGITEKSVVEKMETLREEAQEDGSYNTAYRILEKQMELLGLEEKAKAHLPSGDGSPREIQEAEAEILDEMEEDLDGREDEEGGGEPKELPESSE